MRRFNEDYKPSILDGFLGRVNEEESGKLKESIIDVIYDIKENRSTYVGILVTAPLA